MKELIIAFVIAVVIVAISEFVRSKEKKKDDNDDWNICILARHLESSIYSNHFLLGSLVYRDKCF